MIWYLMIGLVAGGMAGYVTSGRSFGLLADLIVGVLGAWLGGEALNAFGLDWAGILGSLVLAFAGAVILLAFLRVIKSP